MSTTTANLDAMGMPEERKEQTGPGVARQVWWAGLGILGLAGKGVSRLVGTLVEQGKELEPSVDASLHKVRTEVSSTVGGVGTKVREVGEKVRSTAGKGEGAFDERVAATLQRLGVATRDDIQAIHRRLDELASSLGETTESGSEDMEAGAEEGTEAEQEETGRRPPSPASERRPPRRRAP